MFQDFSLGYLVIDEYHNFKTEYSFRHKVFDEVPRIDFGQFKKLLLLSGTVASGAREHIFNFLQLERSFNDSTTTTSTTNFNFITDLPLKEVYKHFQRVQNMDSMLHKSKELLEKYFKRTHFKAVVVCAFKDDVELFKSHYGENVLTVTGDTPADEKENIIDAFISTTNIRLLVGTKLVTEGLDISSVDLVILFNYLPEPEVYIQAVGRLRSNGVCYCLWKPENKKKDSIGPSCATKTIADFYDLKSTSHYGCCENYESLSMESLHIVKLLGLYNETNHRQIVVNRPLLQSRNTTVDTIDSGIIETNSIIEQTMEPKVKKRRIEKDKELSIVMKELKKYYGGQRN